MVLAMEAAQKGEGAVNPNPLVGALIVRNGVVIASGYHKKYGQLHAEREAFADADSRGIDCEGATMYVTLEPCCHYGKQPPCTEAIIAHSIGRVVVGLLDPNPLVGGKGIQILQEAGIVVEMIDEETQDKLRKQNRVFLKYITEHRPWVVMKAAMTLDGKIATATGDSRWVSNEQSRHYVHLMRRSYTGILCGIGTVLADDPLLNVRLSAEECGGQMPRQPIRIVADRQARTPLDSKLVASAQTQRTIVVHSPEAPTDRIEALNAHGVETWSCSNLDEMMQKAADAHIDGILLEGGGILNDAMLQAGLIDEAVFFIAPKLIGGSEAKTPIEGSGIMKMADAVTLTDIRMQMIDDDILVQGFIHKDCKK